MGPDPDEQQAGGGTFWNSCFLISPNFTEKIDASAGETHCGGREAAVTEQGGTPGPRPWAFQ